MSGNIIVDKSFAFSLSVIKAYKQMIVEHKEFVLSKQLLRSGTAIGALIREGVNAESKMDFIHKLAIAQKECDETLYWIDLLQFSDFIQKENAEKLKTDCQEILKILRSIILTTKSRLKK